jgi:hypothetical protein
MFKFSYFDLIDTLYTQSLTLVLIDVSAGGQEDSNWDGASAIPDTQVAAGESQPEENFGGREDRVLGREDRIFGGESQSRSFRVPLVVEVPQPAI